jgi:MFS family permease
MADTSGPRRPAQAGSSAGWRRLRAAGSFPFRLGPADSDWRHQPFAGLAVVNNLSGAGDAFVTVALAGSVFVSVSLNAARGRTALGLLCTLLPFAVVGPLIGPAIDRMQGGRRFIVFLAAVGRLIACLLMVAWLHSLLLFLAAFLSLVCSKTHAVAKAALVPGVVDREDRLVRANSRLAVGGALVTSVAAGIGGLIYKLFGSPTLLDLDALVFATCAVMALYLLRNTREPETAAPAEPVGGAPKLGPGPSDRPDGGRPVDGLAGGTPGARFGRGRGHIGGRPVGWWGGWGVRPSQVGPAQLASVPVAGLRPSRPPFVPRSVRLASVAMAGMRAVAGFMTALVVFGFRRESAPLIWYGLVGVASVGGNFGGALVAPRLRYHFSERMLVAAAAVLIGVTAIGVSFFSALHRWPAAVVLAFVIALGASLAKTAFDAIVQRDTLDRDRSRLFARFESVFQLTWVGGALIPTLIPTPLLVGYLLTAAIVASTSWVFVSGLARQGRGPGPGPGPGSGPPPPGGPGRPSVSVPGGQPPGVSGS